MAVQPVYDRSRRNARQAAKLEAALSDLEGLGLDALRMRWHSITGRAAPLTFRTPLLRTAVAYKLQERAQVGLEASTRRLLHRVADAADPVRRGRAADLAHFGPTVSDPFVSDLVPSSAATARRRSPAPPVRIKLGTRLLRTWQGITHEVLVDDRGVM